MMVWQSLWHKLWRLTLISRYLDLGKNMKFIIAILLGVFMNNCVTSKIKLENFDDLFVGSPTDIEKNMASLLPEAKNKADKSIYIQILSQIAVAQAMQQKIEKAHDTLKKAENYLSKDDFTARIRILSGKRSP